MIPLWLPMVASSLLTVTFGCRLILGASHGCSKLARGFRGLENPRCRWTSGYFCVRGVLCAFERWRKNFKIGVWVFFGAWLDVNVGTRFRRFWEHTKLDKNHLKQTTFGRFGVGLGTPFAELHWPLRCILECSVWTFPARKKKFASWCNLTPQPETRISILRQGWRQHGIRMPPIIRLHPRCTQDQAATNVTHAPGQAKALPAPLGAPLVVFFLHPKFLNFSDFFCLEFWVHGLHFFDQVFGPNFHIFAEYGSFFRLFGSLFLLWCLFLPNFEKTRRLRRLVKIGFRVTFLRVVEALGCRFLNGSY